MNIKYIYTKKGQQEAIILPISFWNEIISKFDLQNYLKSENHFFLKYGNILLNTSLSDDLKKNPDDFFSLFGSWQSDKTGDEIASEIYAASNDNSREITLF
jgi:hypothetical protein